MTNKINYNRRQFLQHSAFGAAALGAFPVMLFAKSGSLKNKPTPGFKPDIEIEFITKNAYIPILKNSAKTKVQKFYARLIKGPESCLVELKNNYLGPILNYTQGTESTYFIIIIN